jgi:uncharacterized protein (DUF362 family)
MTLSRRELLGAALVGGTGLMLRGCRREHPVAGDARPTAPPERSAVAIVRPSAYPSYAEAVAAALALAGGLGFVRPGQRVLLKPAVNSGRPYPATTDAETIAVLARAIQAAGGEPFIAERTMYRRSTATALRETGIRDAAADARIPCLALDDHPVAALHHPLATSWRESTIRVYRAVTEADHVVNLCTPRTHFLGDFTMALKNLVGVVDGEQRWAMHRGEQLRARLAEISLVVRPALVLMDGREGFADGGPDSGDLVRPDFLAVGTDPVAIDAVGLAFLRREGAGARIARGSIWELPTLARAAELGIGVASGERIDLVGAPPSLAAQLRRQMA